MILALALVFQCTSKQVHFTERVAGKEDVGIVAF